MPAVCRVTVLHRSGWASTTTFEFEPRDTDLAPPCYPLEAATKFETKTSEADGWQEKTGVTYLLRSGCIISPLSTLSPQFARVTHTGGYVLPGTELGPGQTPLPDDLEQACVQQIAFWYQARVSRPAQGEGLF